MSFVLFQSQGTFYKKPFELAVVEVTPDSTKYDWLVNLSNNYVNKLVTIPSESLKDLTVSFVISVLSIITNINDITD